MVASMVPSLYWEIAALMSMIRPLLASDSAEASSMPLRKTMSGMSFMVANMVCSMTEY